jgi:integrase/recombinase XerD
MDDLFNEYRDYLKTRESGDITSRLYSINQFITFLRDKGITGLSITLALAEEYKVYLSTVEQNGKYYHRGTINNKLTMLNNFYCWLQKKGVVIANPFVDLKHIKTEEHIPKNILNEEEIDILFAGMELKELNDLIFYLACEILYSCGLRISELVSLKITDLLFERQLIKAADAKTKKERFVPVNDYCSNLIKLYLDYVRPYIIEEKELYLFPQSNGSTTFRCFVNRRLAGLVKKTGIKKKLTTHSFRHSMATALFKNGAGLREVQTLLGHSRIKTTEIYTRVAKEDLKEVLKTRHPRELLFKGKDNEIKP